DGSPSGSNPDSWIVSTASSICDPSTSPNDITQHPAGLSELHVTEILHTPPVCCRASIGASLLPFRRAPRHARDTSPELSEPPSARTPRKEDADEAVPQQREVAESHAEYYEDGQHDQQQHDRHRDDDRRPLPLPLGDGRRITPKPYQRNPHRSCSAPRAERS